MDTFKCLCFSNYLLFASKKWKVPIIGLPSKKTYLFMFFSKMTVMFGQQTPQHGGWKLTNDQRITKSLICTPHKIIPSVSLVITLSPGKINPSRAWSKCLFCSAEAKALQCPLLTVPNLLQSSMFETAFLSALVHLGSDQHKSSLRTQR